MTETGQEFSPLVIADNDVMLDNLPEDVLSTMEVLDRWFASTFGVRDGQSFVIDDLRRWEPGQTIRVAFLGGDTALHREIADATGQITAACNLHLDFGYDATTNTFSTWSTADTAYQAEIRVSFDQSGFFSLVGRDSITPSIGGLFGPVGGRPNQRTLNLGGFTLRKPANWVGVVRHEFLHALAFKHEHQHPAAGCQAEFRFEDDPGYQPTTDAQGRFVPDSSGRRPGIYTYLAGFPNFWSRGKVDHNLRPVRSDGHLTGDFDQESVMLYRFPDLFYKTVPSPCAPLGDGINLSRGDQNALAGIYPQDDSVVVEQTARRRMIFESLSFSENIANEMQSAVRDLLEHQSDE